MAKYNESNDPLRDGLIQRFEFTFELAWKTLQLLFEAEGLTGLNSPKSVLREAFAAQMITDDELWLQMLHDRNLTTRIYNEQLAIRICNDIRDRYFSAFKQLLIQIQGRICFMPASTPPLYPDGKS
jgi:nucleotidyltransferase substrate binding protein (TIGR01987 family)